MNQFVLLMKMHRLLARMLADNQTPRPMLVSEKWQNPREHLQAVKEEEEEEE